MQEGKENMRKTRLDVDENGVKIGGSKIKNLRYIDDTTLFKENSEDLKQLLTIKAEKNVVHCPESCL